MQKPGLLGVAKAKLERKARQRLDAQIDRLEARMGVALPGRHGEDDVPQEGTGAAAGGGGGGRHGGSNRKALLIGINYKGQKGELRGCVNDVSIMRTFLARQGYPTDSDHMLTLVDEGRGPPPTFRNILSGFDWLVRGAHSGDSLFFHYSGHGSQVRDLDGDEADGYDETIIPVDFTTAGQIRDDTLFDKLVKPLPRGCHLTAVVDCCHSGTAMDLPYIFTANRTNMACFVDGHFQPTKLPKMILSTEWEKGLARKACQVVRLGGDVAWAYGKQKVLGDKPAFIEADDVAKAVAGEVVMIGGCRDDQKSADVGNVNHAFELPSNAGPGGAGGACTAALVSVLSDNPHVSIIELLEGMRELIEGKGFRQVPQLSAGKPIALDTPFRVVW